MRLEVVVLKVVVGGQSAVFDDANLEALRRTLYQHNPVEEVEITLREESITTGSCAGDNGVTCLKGVEQARSADAPDPHVYYLGLGHENSVGGVSNIASPDMSSASRRASFSWVGTGAWEGTLGVQIAGHELGHAQNSPHTPGCGAANAVPDYPFVNADGESEIGGWGYEVLNDVLHGPEDTFDIMCYCKPHWSSSYTYEKWARVISELSSWPQRYAETGLPEKVALLRGTIGNGQATWWLVNDSLPAFDQETTGRVRWVVDDGRRLESPVYVAEIADSDYVTVYAALPRGAAVGHKVTVVVDGRQYAVDLQSLAPPVR